MSCKMEINFIKILFSKAHDALLHQAVEIHSLPEALWIIILLDIILKNLNLNNLILLLTFSRFSV